MLSGTQKLFESGEFDDYIEKDDNYYELTSFHSYENHFKNINIWKQER